jgi:hypothetical protein
MQDERQHMRRVFRETWQKREQKETLTPLEKQLLDVIALHPEYHSLLENPQTEEKEYRTDNNPYLHLSLHLGLIEQLSTNRPNGIRDIYQKLYEQHDDEHQAQHMVMEVMGEIMWDAQQSGKLPDEQAYLSKLQKLACS